MAKAAGKSTRRHKYGKGGQKFYGTLEQNKLKITFSICSWKLQPNIETLEQWIFINYFK